MHLPESAPPPTDDTASPCIQLCELDRALQHCVGCGRTLDEIRRWRRMTDEEKRAVNERVGRMAGSPGL